LNDKRWKELPDAERAIFIHDAAVDRGGLAAIALAKATPNMNASRWLALSEKDQRALVVKTMRELPARSAPDMTDDIWYNQLTDEERETAIHDAAVDRGGLAAIALAKATPNMNASRWLALSEKDQRALVVKTMRELPARSAPDMTDDIWYNQVTDEERETAIHDAMAARGAASVQAAGRRAARDAGCPRDWPSLTAEEKLAFLRISNKARVLRASAAATATVLTRRTAIDEMLAATVTMYVDIVMELNPTILTRSTSCAERRGRIRDAMTSMRHGASRGTYVPADHLKMQGGCDKPGRSRPKGKYGTQHFPGVDTFPRGALGLLTVVKEFGVTNNNATHSVDEQIAWLYHRIRALRAKFKTGPETYEKYNASASGKTRTAESNSARGDRRDTAREDKENVGSSHSVTPSTSTSKRQRSSSAPAPLRASSFSPALARTSPVPHPHSQEATALLLSRPSSSIVLRARTRPSCAASDTKMMADSAFMSEEEQDSLEEGDSVFTPSSEDQEDEEYDSDVELRAQVLLISAIRRTHLALSRLDILRIHSQ
jgi:hypothetical protein